MSLRENAQRVVEIVKQLEVLESQLTSLVLPTSAHPETTAGAPIRRVFYHPIRAGKTTLGERLNKGTKIEQPGEPTEEQEEDALPHETARIFHKEGILGGSGKSPFTCCDSRGKSHKKGCVNNTRDYTPKVVHQCCGSKGPNHKLTCASKENFNSEEESEETQEGEGERKVVCTVCDHTWMIGFKVTLGDAQCPSCGATAAIVTNL